MVSTCSECRDVASEDVIAYNAVVSGVGGAWPVACQLLCKIAARSGLYLPRSRKAECWLALDVLEDAHAIS